jgi:hypothetical protein
MYHQRIRKIVVLGGGAAGWISAAVLCKALSPQQCAIELVKLQEVLLRYRHRVIDVDDRIVGVVDAEDFRDCPLEGPPAELSAPRRQRGQGSDG